MQYKGEDLDLRVPTSRPRETYAADYEAGNGRWNRPPTYAAANVDPLWVDEAVLACCNYAFDVAQANGAADVGLEHLLNALTRVETSARHLEQRGVREGQLRRESAALIASEIPVASGGEPTSPRRSAELEDVLRRAVEAAGRRGTSAGVDDVLWAILHYPRDLPAVALLRRLTPDWQRPDWSRVREAQPEHSPQISIPIPRAMPAHGVHAPSYDSFALRMNALEDSIRAVHTEVASERKLLVDLIRDMQRDIVSQRSDAAALRGDIGQRLDGLERGIQARGDAARVPLQLADRMLTLEKAVNTGLSDGARNWAALGQRLQALETGLETGRDGQVPTALIDRIASLERLFESGAGERSRQWAALTERLGSMETYLHARPSDGVLDGGELGERLSGLERALRSGFGDAARTTSTLGERLTAIETIANSGPVGDDGEAALLLDERLGSIERILEDRAADMSEPIQEVVTRLRSLEAKTTSVRGIAGFDADALIMPISERVVAIDNRNAERSAELQSMLGQLATRLTAIEAGVQSTTSNANEAVRTRDREVTEMHEAIVRLSENQHTLASAVADWRHQSNSDLSMINTQLEKLTAAPIAVAAPVVERTHDMLATRTGAANDDGVRRAAYQPPATDAALADGVSTDDAPAQRGFWYWLFGTNSVRSSNREVELRWEQMHQSVRDARERRRSQV